MSFVFRTERISVRELTLSDFTELHKLTSNAEVMKYVGNLKPYSEKQTKQSILKSLRNYGWYGWGGWALEDRVSNELLGYGGLELAEKRAMPELFYIFAPAYWGKGYASEFAIAATNYAFEVLKLESLGASFDSANEASMKVARKAGFQFSHNGFDEFKLPTVYYVKLRRNDLD